MTTSRSSSAPRPDGALLQEQRDYYEARAPEYDDWFFRRGRYDRGPEATERWFAEIAQVRTELAGLNWSVGRTLELAPGTGIWTEWLLSLGATLSVLDASAAMLSVLRQRLGARAGEVEFSQGDLFRWHPHDAFHGVFFSFWVSHVPRDMLAGFFANVAMALDPSGHVAFVDSRRESTSTAVDHVLPPPSDEVMTRRLDDGREFRVVKNFYEPEELVEVAASVGLAIQARSTDRYFTYGWGRRAP